MVKLVLFNGLLVFCCGYAFWRGGVPERLAAAIFVIGTALTRVATFYWGTGFGAVEMGVLAVDLACLISFVFIALRAERFWPLWVAALQIIGTAGHAVKLLAPDMIPWGYAFLLAAGSYPMLLLIALGTYRHQRRLARNGVDPSWSTFSAHSARAPRDGPTG
jgi:hypothetical protein